LLLLGGRQLQKLIEGTASLQMVDIDIHGGVGHVGCEYYSEDALL